MQSDYDDWELLAIKCIETINKLNNYFLCKRNNRPFSSTSTRWSIEETFLLSLFYKNYHVMCSPKTCSTDSNIPFLNIIFNSSNHIFPFYEFVYWIILNFVPKVPTCQFDLHPTSWILLLQLKLVSLRINITNEK